MTRGLRRVHRVVWLCLLVALPIAFVIALATHRPAPVARELPAAVSPR